MRYLTLILLPFVGTVGVMTSVVGSAQVSPQYPTPFSSSVSRKSSWERLQDNAVAARAGDITSIRSLAREVFEPFGWANKKELGAQVEERIAQAELAYRSGGHRPISEVDLVRSVNKLAATFGAPEYCKTDLDQVRELRYELSFAVPALISSSDAEPNKAIPSTMSPIEATYVTLSMIHQKLFNRKYQVTSDEWKKGRQDKQTTQSVDLSSSHRDKRAAGPQLVSTTVSARSQETYTAVSHYLHSMSAGEIQAVPDSILDDLGVSR